MIPLHVPGEAPPPPDVRLTVAALAGLVAALGASAVMRLQSYGYVLSYVAAAAWRRPPERVPRSAADAVGLAAGVGAGLLFEGLVAGYERLRPALGVDVEVVVARVTTLSELLALIVVLAVLYGGFSWFVFPRHGGSAYETRPAAVRRRWAVATIAYGVSLFAALKVAYNVLGV